MSCGECARLWDAYQAAILESARLTIEMSKQSGGPNFEATALKAEEADGAMFEARQAAMGHWRATGHSLVASVSQRETA
jgi:hypothetical protein